MTPSVLVVMGVSGSGKTTVARLVAARLGWRFQEGDDLHPAANVAKMSAGQPLTDADRAPWLHAIAGVIDGWQAAGVSGVLTCSALKHAYRTTIIGTRPGVRLVYLRGSQAQVADRMAHRAGHFMPTGLLQSQFATLEEPAADEHPLVVSIDGTPDALADEIMARLGAGSRIS